MFRLPVIVQESTLQNDDGSAEVVFLMPSETILTKATHIHPSYQRCKTRLRRRLHAQQLNERQKKKLTLRTRSISIEIAYTNQVNDLISFSTFWVFNEYPFYKFKCTNLMSLNWTSTNISGVLEADDKNKITLFAFVLALGVMSHSTKP